MKPTREIRFDYKDRQFTIAIRDNVDLFDNTGMEDPLNKLVPVVIYERVNKEVISHGMSWINSKTIETDELAIEYIKKIINGEE